MTVVRWSYKARIRLREIHAYIAKDSPLRARQVLERLIRRGDSLKTEPRADRRVPEYPEDDLREVLERPYRLIYQINSAGINIITVKHYRQRLPSRAADL
jgi:toxin ParE1/3/4